MGRHLALIMGFVLGLFISSTPAHGGDLYVGTAVGDITPRGPIAVDGQFNLRIARVVETPLSANVIVLETRNGDRSLDCAVMVSCDLVGIPDEVLGMVREDCGGNLTS